MTVEPIPDGYHTVTPYLVIQGAGKVIEFAKRAFGAKERMRVPGPNGTIGHAEIEIGGARVFLADAPDDMPGDAGNPRKLGGTTVLLHRYVSDVDAAVATAKAAGATVLREPEDQFYGDRASVVQDPWGHQWSLHTHLRDVSAEEMAKAVEKMTQS
jgi:PhnB protein